MLDVRRAALLAACLSVVGARRAEACAAAFREGESGHIASERALIVWDAERKVEHFVREAEFETQARDFGFLVPTPAPPELAEADPAVFDRLAQPLVPLVDMVEHFEKDWTLKLPPVEVDYVDYDPRGHTKGVRKNITSFGAESTDGEEPAVRVVRQQNVAGYDATVLEAKRADALSAWLTEHHYPSSPALEAWFKPYVEKGWAITAFKFEGGAKVRTTLVRLSFQADAPFYPYREPVSARSEYIPRLLQVFTVATGRLDPKLPEGALQGQPHVARLFSDPPGSDQLPPHMKNTYASAWSGLGEALEGAVPKEAVSKGAWLTAMEDYTRTRPDAELLFEPSSEGENTPRPITRYRITTVHLGSALPAGALVLAALAFAGAALRRRFD